MTSTTSGFPSVDTNLEFNNFDPDSITTEEVVNMVLLFDDSYSMQKVKALLNGEIKVFIESIQGWITHVNKIYVSMGTFSETVTVLTGFQPIVNVQIPVLDPQGNSTHLYEGCLEFLKNMLSQQQTALNAGVLTKNIFVVFTDGDDTTQTLKALNEVRKITDFINNDESLMGTFVSVMCGIGQNPQIFEDAKDKMGLQTLFTFDPTDPIDKIKKAVKSLFTFLSQSVSSASGYVPPVNF